MRSIRGWALVLVVWLNFAAAAWAQQSGKPAKNPLGFMDRVMGIQTILMIIGVGVVGLVILWAIFQFVIKLMFMTKHADNKNDLGGWKPQ